jgi:catalase
MLNQLAISATLALSTAAAQAAQPTPSEMVDALNNTFGKHAQKRASHAKGFCAVGEFTPDAKAAAFADSPLFRQKSASAQVRFSIGGGNPGVSDKSRSVRGIGARLSGGGETYDLVLISEPAFFAATPESFVSFLAARVPDPATKKPDPAKVAAHNAAHPDGKIQPALLAAHAAPQSYATTPYFSNNAFIFTGSDKQQRHARIVVQPEAGTHYLTEEQEKSFPDQFLKDELTQRLAAGQVRFTITAQLPATGDSLRDPSQVWQGAGHVTLGTLTVSALADDACERLVYMPVTLPASIAPSDDPILQSRAAAYAESLARRSK